MRFFLVMMAAGAAFGQNAPAPAPKLTGFPFQNETLHYKVRWTDGMILGDGAFSARRVDSGWSFGLTIEAGIPGFAIKDLYQSNATEALCSVDFERRISHRTKQSTEKTSFDQGNHRATRTTTVPANGGKTEMQISSCAKDAVTFVYFMRREMGQGRVAPAETVYFGGGYSVSLKYTGEGRVRDAVVDHVIGSVRGTGSTFTVEIDFARDAARTPLLIKVPLAVGAVRAELVK